MLSILRKLSILMDKNQKKKVGILFFITLIGAFLEVLGVSLMLPLVSAIMNPDIIYTNSTIKHICEVLDLHSHRTFVIVCIVCLIAVFVFKDVFLIGQYYIQSRFIYNNQFATQQKLFKIFMNKSYEYYLNAESGEILRIIQNDVVTSYALLTTLMGMLTETIVSLALIITIFIINPMMTVFVAAMLGLIMLVITKVVKPILRSKGIEKQEQSALLYKWILQGITGIKEIKVANKEKFFEQNYEMSGRKYISAEKWNYVFGNAPRLLIEMVSVGSMLTFIAISIYNGVDIEKLIPALGAFAMAAVKLMPSANRIVSAINQIAFQGPALDRLVEDFRDLKTQKSTDNNEKSNTNFNNIKINRDSKIIMENIYYKYPNNEKYILEGSNMEIPIGNSIGIVGKSGAGKTTVVDILLGLLKTEKGRILLDGIDIMNNHKEWYAHIGYIPQSIFILDDSIRANVAFGLPNNEIDENKVWNALKEAQLDEYVKSLPDGINTKIGERGVRISGGQRQRIGIARALYENPEILVFDEATSALDNETETAIMESINSLHGKKTLIIIAHRLQTIQGCDIVYRVENRKIIKEK